MLAPGHGALRGVPAHGHQAGRHCRSRVQAPARRSIVDPEICLLAQGLLCMGPATRGGCGAPCIGRQHALHRLLRADQPRHATRARKPSSAHRLDARSPTTRTRSSAILDQIPDPVGTFYRYGLPASLLAQAASSTDAPRHVLEHGQPWLDGDEPATRRRITIDPITRLEGHGKIDIFLDDEGEVDRAYFQVPELRGFEKFAVGPPAEDMPQITSRICGVCPTAHHMAATKALDALYSVEPAARRPRRSGSWSTTPSCSRTTPCTSTSSAGPTSSSGPTPRRPSATSLGVIGKVGVEVGKKVIAMRRQAARDDHRRLGGKVIHPVFGLPGGVSRPITAEEPQQFVGVGRRGRRVRQVHASRSSTTSCSANPDYVELITSDAYTHGPTTWAWWTRTNKVNFYDGTVRVVDPDGQGVLKFPAARLPRPHRRARRAVDATSSSAT